MKMLSILHVYCAGSMVVCDPKRVLKIIPATAALEIVAKMSEYPIHLQNVPLQEVAALSLYSI